MRRFLILALLATLVGCAKKEHTVDELLAEARQAYDRADFYDARQLLLKAVAGNPSHREALFWLGRCYRQEYMYDSAVFYLHRADMIKPKDLDTQSELYQAHRAAGHWSDARRALWAMITLGEPEEQHLQELQELSIKGQEYDHAYYWSRKLIKAYPDSAQYWFDAANMAAQLDSVGVAINILDSAIERFGPLPGLVNNKATYLVMIGDYHEAEKAFRTLLAADDQPEYKLNLANALASQNDRAKKREAYDIYLSIRSYVEDQRWMDSVLQDLGQQLGIKQ